MLVLLIRTLKVYQVKLIKITELDQNVHKFKLNLCKVMYSHKSYIYILNVYTNPINKLESIDNTH